MRYSVLLLLYLVIGVLLLAPPAVAHHSHSMYDFEKSVSLSGVVRKVRWANPHVHFEIEAQNDDGEYEPWVIETEPPAIMSKFGWHRDSFAPGDRVTIEIIPARNPARKMAIGVSAVTAKGEHLWISGAAPYDEQAKDLPMPYRADDLSGVWSTRFDPEAFVKYRHLESPSPLLTSAGNKALEAVENDDYDYLPPGTECIPNPVPFTMLVPVSTEIEIGETTTFIRFEGDQGLVERVVHMDLTSHDGASYENQGHSIGWWEADVFVVDTTHFEVNAYGHGRGLTSSPKKHLVERFELNPDHTKINYTFWVEDPEVLAEPATATIQLLYRPDLELLDVPCDPDSAREYVAK